MAILRTKLICGNWKLNHSLAQTRHNIKAVAQGLADVPAHVEVAIAPVAPFLFAACEEAKGSRLQIAAQNLFYENQGAFTGEWCAAQLRELGCTYAIVGHSERRQIFLESDDWVQKKIAACLAAGLKPIACVGETLKERESGQMETVLERQLNAILAANPAQQELVVAYEPIWAIGTGKTATPEEAQAGHALIRHFARPTRILYGGSVNPDNAPALLAKPDIDGLLVGGASLQAESFLAIVNAAFGL